MGPSATDITCCPDAEFGLKIFLSRSVFLYSNPYRCVNCGYGNQSLIPLYPNWVMSSTLETVGSSNRSQVYVLSSDKASSPPKPSKFKCRD